MNTYILEIAVFLVGAIIMILEILGLKIIAPHFGTALTVSSNFIGVILLSLSLGYYLGGKIADWKLNKKFLSYFILAPGLYLAAFFPFKDIISSFLKAYISNIAFGSFAAICVLFAPISIMLGLILPYAIKFKTNEISSAGKTIGFIYLLSTAGSILGTFLAGFVIIPYLSLTYSIIFLIFILFFLSIAVFPENKKGFIVIPLIALLFPVGQKITYDVFGDKDKLSIDGSVIIDKTKLKKIDDVNSNYSRIEIYEGADEKTQRPIRLMRVNRELHSGSFLDSNELLFKYSKFNRLAGHFNPNAKKALLIGGGGYSYAKYFLSDTPLHDVQKIWKLDNKFFNNDNKLVFPILITENSQKRLQKPELIYQSPNSPFESEIEGTKNFLEAQNQSPDSEIIIKKAEIYETGLDENNGFVHIHETKNDGTPGEIISPDYYIHRPRNIIGHSELFSGKKENISIVLDRPSREGEVLYPMLHRDNGNKRFDPILVDGYEKIEFLDIVEIDPKTTKLAEKYFGLNRDDPRLKIFHEDGRTYINRTKNKYDIIYLDVFQNFYSIPYQLTTLEAAQKIYSLLNEKGVVLINAPSAISGKNGRFFQAELKTYKQIFPEVRVFAVTSPQKEEIIQNLIIIGFKSKDNIRKTPNDDAEINKFLKNEWRGFPKKEVPVLTDEFAPVDYYINEMINIDIM